jgi:hypothetical protein
MVFPTTNKTMDPISVEAMLMASGVKLGKARIMFRHIRHFLEGVSFHRRKKDAVSSVTIHTHQRSVENPCLTRPSLIFGTNLLTFY